MPISFKSRFHSGAPRGIALGRAVLAAGFILFASGTFALADKLHLADGSNVEVDEAWEDAQGVWYRRGGVSHLIDRSRVRRIERATPAGDLLPPQTIAETNKYSVN